MPHGDPHLLWPPAFIGALAGAVAVIGFRSGQVPSLSVIDRNQNPILFYAVQVILSLVALLLIGSSIGALLFAPR